MLFSRRLPRLVASTLHLLPLLRQQQHQAVAFTTLNIVAANPLTCPASPPLASTFPSSRPTTKPRQACAMSSSAAAATGAAEPTLAASVPAAEASMCAATNKSNEKEEETNKLPPLSAAEFKVYNRMAEHMDLFHAHFRQSWNLLWSAATGGKRPAGMSPRAFLAEGLQFLHYLTVHHNIEEQHIFPVLARKMPEFKAGRGNGAAELLRQHRQIHAGMDGLEAYLTACQSGEADLEMRVLKTKMESWADVLWTHLDHEVKTLGAENMRKYWTPDEMRRLPM
ncbi:hypothetical protein PG999_007285 [Apiospora kogelbergensis]|uniref:Hemerythrin-like domain-containing protein n=1 Tax=Apiospora kogelbergensis TaxID=1337665 RepID=A0AAW0QXV1_9PEZI